LVICLRFSANSFCLRGRFSCGDKSLLKSADLRARAATMRPGRLHSSSSLHREFVNCDHHDLFFPDSDTLMPPLTFPARPVPLPSLLHTPEKPAKRSQPLPLHLRYSFQTTSAVGLNFSSFRGELGIRSVQVSVSTVVLTFHASNLENVFGHNPLAPLSAESLFTLRRISVHINHRCDRTILGNILVRGYGANSRLQESAAIGS